MKALDGRVALVTGSSRGIGAAIARRFAQEGASVALHGRNQAALSEVQADIDRSGGRTTRAVADLTRFDEIERMRLQARPRMSLGPRFSSRPAMRTGSPG